MTSRARGDKPSLEVVSKSSILLFNTKKGSQIRESNHVENPSAGNGSHFYDVYSHSHMTIMTVSLVVHRPETFADYLVCTVAHRSVKTVGS
jgi:hypothetical protein